MLLAVFLLLKMILVSACLAGIDCCFDGKGRLNKKIKKLVREKKAIALCPEILGGLRIRRLAAEILKGDGRDVLKGKTRVKDKRGRDVTENFILGAYAVLKIAKENKVKRAFLKSKSPSCGLNQIYDGTFKKRLKKGSGVLAALLKKEGIKVREI